MLKRFQEAKKQLWKISGDQDFEEKSQALIDETLAGLEKDACAEFLKYLEQIQADRIAKQQRDQNHHLAIAKGLINSTKYEEDHIFDMVDQHANLKVAPLDRERREDYIEYRDKIQHERFIMREQKRDQDNYRQQEDVESRKAEVEGRRTYTRPGSETYHLIKDCGGEASNYGKAYETKVPCKVCQEYTEDTINSSIQPKGIGFIPGKVEYHDDDCLIWVSHTERVLKQICATCERERIYAEDIDRQLREELIEQNKSTGSGSQQRQTA